MCSTKVTEQDEIEFIEANGRCFICDHHSVFDEMPQDELDDYFAKQ